MKKPPSDDSDDDALIGIAFRRSFFLVAALGILSAVIYFGMRRKPVERNLIEDVVELPDRRAMPLAKAPTILWTDRTLEAGIDFTHYGGARGDKLLPETMGGGCAFFDFDGDLDQDILLINSCDWNSVPEHERVASPLGLYENDGKGNFTNVTERLGLRQTMYGMGVACGDYDLDGRIDLFISCLGKDRLFHNEGVTFREVTDEAGVGGDENAWSVSSGWFDYDRDGDLDLLVCHYVEWNREYDLAQKFRLLGGEIRAYGRPQAFAGTFPTLFRNEGNGRFTDISKEAGIQIAHPATGTPVGKSLGLVFDDFDDDGYLDCVVANDTVQNFLLHNQRDGTFAEIGMMAGIAFDAAGAARGAMGIDSAAFRNDRSVGVVIGNFANEMSALYVAKERQLQFYDAAVANGFGPATRLDLTFGVLFLDFDLDGRLDIFQSNGHLEEDIAKVQSSQRYAQSPQLFWNAGPQYGTEFIKCLERETGPAFQKPMVGRGASYADIDGDGDLDLLIAACGQSPRLLRNDQSTGHHWLRVKLVGKRRDHEGMGAKIELHAGGKILYRRVNPTRSYLSQVELPVTFGLGTTSSIDRLRIIWPDGTEQSVESPSVDQLLVVKRLE